MAIEYVLIKLASRCNFDCSYCYWFRDGSVRRLPALISDTVLDAFVEALRRHLNQYRLQHFVCSFHGGEPTLYSARKLRRLLEKIAAVGIQEACSIEYALTTNGSRLNDDWIKLIKDFRISVAVSIDGPPAIHDRRRVTIKGEPTWRDTVAGYVDLCRAGVRPAIIAVCDPTVDPESLLDHFFSDLGATYCDVLPPENNHNEATISIADYYIRLFDHWNSVYRPGGSEVRILSGFIRGLFGLQSRTEIVGYSSSEIVCLNTNGQLEPHDGLRIAGEARSRTECNIICNELSDVESDPLWMSVREASVSLCEQCSSCRYKVACGGGHIVHRWSDQNGYKNPSVYCADYQRILDHVSAKLSAELASGDDAASKQGAIYSALTRGRPVSILDDLVTSTRPI